jgi:hypothetical protein
MADRPVNIVKNQHERGNVYRECPTILQLRMKLSKCRHIVFNMLQDIRRVDPIIAPSTSSIRA